MIYFLIYILGAITTLWILYRSLDSGTRVALADLLLAILISIFSWIGIILVIIIVYGDKTVFKKK